MTKDKTQSLEEVRHYITFSLDDINEKGVNTYSDKYYYLMLGAIKEKIRNLLYIYSLYELYPELLDIVYQFPEISINNTLNKLIEFIKLIETKDN